MSDSAGNDAEFPEPQHRFGSLTLVPKADEKLVHQGLQVGPGSPLVPWLR